MCVLLAEILLIVNFVRLLREFPQLAVVIVIIIELLQSDEKYQVELIESHM